MTNLSGANLNNGAAAGSQGKGMDSPSTFPKYSAYKDSGVEWAGALPAEWQVLKLKRAARLQSGELITSEAIEDDAQYPVYGGNGLRGYTVNYTHDGEFALIGRQGALCGNINYAEGKFWASEHAVVVYPEKGIVTRWLGELLRSMNLGQYSVSAAQPGLSVERIADLLIPMASQAEQTQIARFLDHETARIDALIEEQQRLIELLKEKRQAVISHAITKGLDPTVPMKDSGVEWLGEVPAHWKVSKLGHYAQILTGFPFPSASFSHDESDVRLLRGANIGVGSLKWIDTVYWSLSEGDNLSSYLMEEGQIVLGMDRPWISEGMRIARITKEDMPCLLLQRVAAIRPSAELDDEYLFCLLASELFKTYVEPDLTGVSVPHISPEQIMSFQISVPEIGEQRRISSFIKNQLDQMAALFEQASESVELLQERRSALISAAVTGKIDVRGWQPPASAQTPELEQEAV